MAHLLINDLKKQEHNFENYLREIQIFKQPEDTCTLDLKEIFLM